MMSHDEMINNATYRSGVRGLHYFADSIIRKAAAGAARAAFEACDGKSTDWRSWTHPSGRMIKLAHGLLAMFLSEHPNASPEETYFHLSYFPCDGEKIPFSNGNIWGGDPVPWDALPGAVRAAYEAFAHVYLHLWVIARTHNDNMARTLPPMPRPQLVHDSNVVRLPVAGDGAA